MVSSRSLPAKIKPAACNNKASASTLGKAGEGEKPELLRFHTDADPARMMSRQEQRSGSDLAFPQARAALLGAPGGNRTPDRRIRRPLLYPLSYWGNSASARPLPGYASKVYSASRQKMGKTRSAAGPAWSYLSPNNLCGREFSTWRPWVLPARRRLSQAGVACLGRTIRDRTEE
jgi:hypothetical protein